MEALRRFTGRTLRGRLGVVCSVIVCLAAALRAPAQTRSAAADIPADIALFFREFSECVARGDLPSAEALAAPDASRLRSHWRRLFGLIHPAYTDVRALVVLERVGVRGERAFVRYTLEATGLRRGERQTSLATRTQHEAVLHRADSGWRFARHHWDTATWVNALRPVVAAPPSELTAPFVLHAALELRAGRPRLLRVYWWLGRAAEPGTPLSGEAGRAYRGQTVTAQEALDYLSGCARGAEALEQDGVVHCFLQREGSQWLPVESIWHPDRRATPTDENARAVAGLRAQLAADWANGELHAALARALCEAGLVEEAADEYERADALGVAAAGAERRRALAGVGKQSRDELLKQQRDRVRARQLARTGGTANAKVPLHLQSLQPAQMIVGADFVVRYHQGDPTVPQALAALEEANRVSRELFGFKPGPAHIVVFLDQQEFLSYRSARGERSPPEWSGGAFDPTGIYTYQRTGLRRTLAHEYGHEVVRQAAGGKVVPTWLHEGVACLLEGGPPRYAETLGDMQARKQHIAYTQLGGEWQGFDPETAGAAYCQSRSMVELLLDTQDQSVVLLILDDMRSGHVFDAAFRRRVRFGTKRLSPKQFVDEWARRVVQAERSN